MSLQGVKTNPEATKEDLRRMALQINELTQSVNATKGTLRVTSSPVLTGNQNITDEYSIWLCDASTGNMTLTIPAIDDFYNRPIWVNKIDNTSNSVIWNAPVNGSTSATISVQYTSLTFVASAGSTEWRII